MIHGSLDGALASSRAYVTSSVASVREEAYYSQSKRTSTSTPRENSFRGGYDRQRLPLASQKVPTPEVAVRAAAPANEAVPQAGGWTDVVTMERCCDSPDDGDLLSVTSETDKRRETLSKAISGTN